MTDLADADPALPGGQRIVLASGSPRRLDLLRSAGVDPEVLVPDVDESPLPGEAPVAYVDRIARSKALAVEVAAGRVVVAADTTVDLDGRILAKPCDAASARSMLEALSGRSHLVHTAVAVRRDQVCDTRVVTTGVGFALLDEATVEWYVATGESFGKAGAYAIQGSGARLVEWVHGSVTNVIGLPLAELFEMLG
ncbi:MAG: Maf family protein [Microthrixaceae bacterium]|nr:septum formation protein Maf [Microthrixaceae bacterium]MCO5319081.1 Maf family protein [Microthrixaceae bacterium]